jgi:capsular polysaccharide biosynthesis protein
VDLNEAAQRIFKHHWVLIALVTLIGLGVPLALAQRQGDDYVANARLIIGGADTRDAQEAAALADTALGLATSPSVLNRAISETGVRRADTDVATGVTITPVGTSGVLELTVTDRDADVATALVNALADQIVALREDVVLGGSRQLLTQTGQQIDALTQNIADIENQQARPAAPVATLELRRQEAVAQRAALESQRQQLNAELATTVAPRVIDDSADPGTPVSSALPARLAVGALLGLLVGVALAAGLESLRPTLNRAALARRLGAPLLGHLPRRPEHDGALSDPWLVNYLSLAAKDSGVHSVQLVPVGPAVDVVRLAEWLDLPGEGGPHVVPLVLDASGSRDEVVAQQQLAETGTGVVVVAPSVVQGQQLADVERYVQLTKRPVIGVISYSDSRSTPRRTSTDQEEMADAADPTFEPPVTRDDQSVVSPAS